MKFRESLLQFSTEYLPSRSLAWNIQIHSRRTVILPVVFWRFVILKENTGSSVGEYDNNKDIWSQEKYSKRRLETNLHNARLHYL